MNDVVSEVDKIEVTTLEVWMWFLYPLSMQSR